MLLQVLHPKFISKLESDAKTQARYHLIMSYAWLLSMIVTPFMSAFHGQIAALLIMEVSLYANFATEFGALAAAQASLKADGQAPPPAVG